MLIALKDIEFGTQNYILKINKLLNSERNFIIFNTQVGYPYFICDILKSNNDIICKAYKNYITVKKKG